MSGYLEEGAATRPATACRPAPPASAAAPAAASREPSWAAPEPSRPSDLGSVSKRLELEQLQRSQRHSPEAGDIGGSEFPAVEVAAPGRTLDCGGRQYRCNAQRRPRTACEPSPALPDLFRRPCTAGAACVSRSRVRPLPAGALCGWAPLAHPPAPCLACPC